MAQMRTQKKLVLEVLSKRDKGLNNALPRE